MKLLSASLLASVAYGHAVHLSKELPPPAIRSVQQSQPSEKQWSTAVSRHFRGTAIDPLYAPLKPRGDRPGNGDCSESPTGAAFKPDSGDTWQDFMAMKNYSTIAQNANIPDRYELVFKDLSTSVIMNPTYLGLFTIYAYDTELCADYCDDNPKCKSFNIYVERSPSKDPGPGCPNPPATYNYKCTLYWSPIDIAVATNDGQLLPPADASGQEFVVKNRGSNGYNKLADPPAPPAIAGYRGPFKLPGAIDQSATYTNDTGGNSSFLIGPKYFQGRLDTTLCSTLCNEVTDKRRKEAEANCSDSGAERCPWQPCNYFNAYVVSNNNVAQGWYCALFSTDMPTSHGTINETQQGSVASSWEYIRSPPVVNVTSGSSTDGVLNIPAKIAVSPETTTVTFISAVTQEGTFTVTTTVTVAPPTTEISTTTTTATVKPLTPTVAYSAKTVVSNVPITYTAMVPISTMANQAERQLLAFARSAVTEGRNPIVTDQANHRLAAHQDPSSTSSYVGAPTQVWTLQDKLDLLQRQKDELTRDFGAWTKERNEMRGRSCGDYKAARNHVLLTQIHETKRDMNKTVENLKLYEKTFPRWLFDDVAATTRAKEFTLSDRYAELQQERNSLHSVDCEQYKVWRLDYLLYQINRIPQLQMEIDQVMNDLKAHTLNTLSVRGDNNMLQFGSDADEGYHSDEETDDEDLDEPGNMEGSNCTDADDHLSHSAHNTKDVHLENSRGDLKHSVTPLSVRDDTYAGNSTTVVFDADGETTITPTKDEDNGRITTVFADDTQKIVNPANNEGPGNGTTVHVSSAGTIVHDNGGKMTVTVDTDNEVTMDPPDHEDSKRKVHALSAREDPDMTSDATVYFGSDSKLVIVPGKGDKANQVATVHTEEDGDEMIINPGKDVDLDDGTTVHVGNKITVVHVNDPNMAVDANHDGTVTMNPHKQFESDHSKTGQQSGERRPPATNLQTKVKMLKARLLAVNSSSPMYGQILGLIHHYEQKAAHPEA